MTAVRRTTADLRALQAQAEAVTANIERAIVGKPEAVRLVVLGLLAAGHVLIEDVPGVGKTVLARSLARSLACDFRRVQFTPDLLPSDLTGVSVFDPREQAFSFHPGPLFASVVLADEINRAAPRTQSALLEAMSDRSVTVDGETRALPTPFIVLATQNPIEHAGTYPLPEAQLDRFLLRVTIGYPDAESELEMLASHRRAHPLDTLGPVLDAAAVSALQKAVRAVEVEPDIARYLLAIVRATREHPELELGASPRAAKMLLRAAQAAAVLDARGFVTPDDVKALAAPVLAHRLIERDADLGGHGRVRLVEGILREVPVPL